MPTITEILTANLDAEAIPVDVIPDPIDGWAVVVYCPCCDNAYGVTTLADEAVTHGILADHGVGPVTFDGIAEARLATLTLVLNEQVAR